MAAAAWFGGGFRSLVRQLKRPPLLLQPKCAVKPFGSGLCVCVCVVLNAISASGVMKKQNQHSQCPTPPFALSSLAALLVPLACSLT